MFDTLIKNATVVDGTLAEPFVADVALEGGQIAAVGRIDDGARRVIDAEGLHLLPGFVDLHTHYDGQASWDETFAPSIYHGITTLVMGNCGVGFAPVRPGGEQRLIELMEGVEEIPGSALAEGIRWGWESFGEYGRALDAIPHSLDFLTLVPHDSLRLYVMGERAERGENATDDDLAQMKVLLRQALLDGAIGFGMGSSEVHRTSRGRMTPSFRVAGRELNALASALQGLPYRVLQAVNDFSSTVTPEGESRVLFEQEYAKLENMVRAAGRPLSMTWMERLQIPHNWQWLGEAALASAAKGLTIRLQCASRGIGVLNGLDTTMNLLLAFPGYREIAHLAPAERAARLREPALRARILAEQPVPLSQPGNTVPALADQLIANFERVAFQFFPYREVRGNVDYEPDPSASFGAQAKARGVSAKELVYDYLAEGDGTNLIYFPIYNYLHGSLDTVYEMLNHPLALVALGDGGAHVGTICDASYSTTMLAHWALRRTRGPRLPLPKVVHMLSQCNAAHLGLADRGTIAPGKKADLNLVDLERLALPLPRIVRDLPAGGRRMVQKAEGYIATFVSGQAVVEHGEITQARPGRWVRAPA